MADYEDQVCPRPGSRPATGPKTGDRRLISTWASSTWGCCGNHCGATGAGGLGEFLNACRENHTGIDITMHDRLYDMANGRDWRNLAEDGVDSGYELRRPRPGTANSPAKMQAGEPPGTALMATNATIIPAPANRSPSARARSQPVQATKDD